jgi:hypothetical protein
MPTAQRCSQDNPGSSLFSTSKILSYHAFDYDGDTDMENVEGAEAKPSSRTGFSVVPSDNLATIPESVDQATS